MFSSKEFITLAEEIDFIKSYIELVLSRSPNTFTYSLTCDEGLDQHVVFPSLLSQPFIENAVRHGLVHQLEGEKRLDIKIT